MVTALPCHIKDCGETTTGFTNAPVSFANFEELLTVYRELSSAIEFLQDFMKIRTSSPKIPTLHPTIL